MCCEGNALISSAFHCFRILGAGSPQHPGVPPNRSERTRFFFQHAGVPVHGMICNMVDDSDRTTSSGRRHAQRADYLSSHAAHDLVKLARQSSDETLSLELEKMAIEMLKRAGDLERDSRI
jgi:hypothetical protein